MLLCSSEEVDREFAVEKIMELCDQLEERDTQANMVRNPPQGNPQQDGHLSQGPHHLEAR